MVAAELERTAVAQALNVPLKMASAGLAAVGTDSLGVGRAGQQVAGIFKRCWRAYPQSPSPI